MGTSLDSTIQLLGTQFGGFISRVANTEYQADTDGIAIAIRTGVTGNNVEILVDSTSPATTQRAVNVGTGGSNGCTVTVPVPKGHYWKASVNATSVYWLPTPSVEIPAGLGELGTRVSRTDDTVYQAEADGFLYGYITATISGNDARAQAFVDDVNPPLANTGGASCIYDASHTTNIGSFCTPVKAGQYYKAKFFDQTTGGTHAFFWQPVVHRPTSYPSGAVIQVQNTQTGAMATGNNKMPWDDTIPQITEGDEYMTCSITPTSATSKLRIEVHAIFECATSEYKVMGLFRDTTADALASCWEYANTSSGELMSLSHFVTADSTNPTTFRVRLGNWSASALNTFNGENGARRMGGTASSSITITEIAV